VTLIYNLIYNIQAYIKLLCSLLFIISHSKYPKQYFSHNHHRTKEIGTKKLIILKHQKTLQNLIKKSKAIMLNPFNLHPSHKKERKFALKLLQ